MRPNTCLVVAVTATGLRNVLKIPANISAVIWDSRKFTCTQTEKIYSLPYLINVTINLINCNELINLVNTEKYQIIKYQIIILQFSNRVYFLIY